jgi:hypothetical protein
MTTAPDTVDLRQRRIDRAKARVAKREGRGERLTIRDGDSVIAVLEAEFPLDVLEPLVDVNLDIALVIEQAITMATADDQAQQIAAIDLIVKILAGNPDLFRELIDAIKEMVRRLFGQDGYTAFVATRPSVWDISDLVKALMAWYGVSLGEASPPSTASNGGGTSRPTSNGTSASTPVVSGSVLESGTSSVSDVL